MKLITLATAIGLAATLTGCDGLPYRSEPSNPTAKYIMPTYDVVDSLITQLERKQVSTGAPMLVATVVNVDRLESASRLGRSIAEQVSTRLAQRGFRVVEVKLRGNLFVKNNEGELLLSREIAQISQSHNAPAVVVGTYAAATDFIHVNLKVVSATSQAVLAAADYSLPLDYNTGAMLEAHR